MLCLDFGDAMGATESPFSKFEPSCSCKWRWNVVVSDDTGGKGHHNVIMILAVSVKSSFKRQPLTCYVTSFCVPTESLRKIYLKSLKPMDAVGCLWPHHVISDNKILQAQEIKRSIPWCLGTGMGQMLVCCAVPQGQSCHDEIQCMYHTVPESAVARSASLHLIHFLFKLVTQFEMVEVPWFSILGCLEPGAPTKTTSLIIIYSNCSVNGRCWAIPTLWSVLCAPKPFSRNRSQPVTSPGRKQQTACQSACPGPTGRGQCHLSAV